MKKIKLTVAAAGAAAVFLASCASLEQQPDQAWIRAPGHREGSLAPVATKAQEHWQYAWISEAAYQESEGEGAGFDSDCQDPKTVLEENGWSKWRDFPDGELASDLKKAHLRAEVWYNPRLNTITVAFGGTVFRSGQDWISNLRWFIPGDRNDEYTALVRRFIPAWRAKFVALKGKPENKLLASATLVSTGHSLGGGLAQQFAYALPNDGGLPRVSKVYAFDPSPVTGYYSVERSIRDANRQNLEIERIYENGEVLASLRSLLAVVYPLAERAPAITEIRYNLFADPRTRSIKARARAAVHQHSIAVLASAMTKAAGVATAKLTGGPERIAQCSGSDVVASF